jgi:predicted house-cleaning noncanonical NTP pyrophosphatase (MazG superfamily)
MGVKDLLWQNRSAIVEKWFDRIVETYPANSRKFIKERKDQFANPVGSTILQGIEGLYVELLREMDKEKVTKYLDPIMRIQAVQGFSPSQALSFIPSVKRIVREEFGKKILENRLAEELLEFETRVDQLTLLAFDNYMKCREKIYEIQVQELRNRSVEVMGRIQRREIRQEEIPGIPRGAGDREE